MESISCYYNDLLSHYGIMMNFQDYIQHIRSLGSYSFTAEQAILDLKISKEALNSRVYKLKKKKGLITPARNFYVIVPPEHQSMGSLPAEELIPIVMKYLQVDYYVCLLSAAYYHGASHQKAQVFQIMVSQRLKNIEHGKIRLEFMYKKNWKPEGLFFEHIQKRVVKTGYLNISSPELTAMDLLSYKKSSGGLNAIATVLSELIEVFDPSRLLKLLEQSESNAWWQRLGCILEKIEVMVPEKLEEVLGILQQHAEKNSASWVLLAPELEKKGIKRSALWRVIENTTIEGDL